MPSRNTSSTWEAWKRGTLKSSPPSRPRDSCLLFQAPSRCSTRRLCPTSGGGMRRASPACRTRARAHLTRPTCSQSSAWRCSPKRQPGSACELTWNLHVNLPAQQAAAFRPGHLIRDHRAAAERVLFQAPREALTKVLRGSRQLQIGMHYRGGRPRRAHTIMRCLHRIGQRRTSPTVGPALAARCQGSTLRTFSRR